jgi:alpha-1,6-mannosyltransferase
MASQVSADTETEASAVEAESPPPTVGPLPKRTIALGAAGSLMMLLAAFGAAAVPVHDPILGNGPFSFIRYGHGQMLASLILYAGFVMLVWAWVRLGRHVLDGRTGSRPVLIAAALWTAPMIIAPAMFTRDVFSYIAQGALALQGFDPYTVGPTSLDSPDIVQNVHPFWQSTPAPYGPLFILLAKGVGWLTGTNVIAGVVLTRVVQLIGLALLLWALPGLVRHLGGKLPTTLWLAIAGPMTVVHLVGGPHNDLLMIGFLAAGTLLVLDRKHVLGIAVVTLGVGVKATAVVALPFLVWVWAGHLSSTRWRNFVRAAGCALATFVSIFAGLTLVAGVDLGWITMLNSSSRIVNWLSLPTAAGELIHSLVGIFVDLSKDYFVTVTRILGMLLLVIVVVRQWWLARDGGPDAIRRAGIALFAVAILSPTTLPWYLTWGLVLTAGLAWQRRHLAIVAGIAAFMVVTYTPDGETNLYNWPFMAVAVALSTVAGLSILRPDPLRLSNRDELPEPAGTER